MNSPPPLFSMSLRFTYLRVLSSSRYPQGINMSLGGSNDCTQMDSPDIMRTPSQASPPGLYAGQQHRPQRRNHRKRRNMEEGTLFCTMLLIGKDGDFGS
jgi:hypothetical protein